MPDHTHRAYRGPAQGDQQSSSGGDPLAELARLIGGQNDPFAAPARGGRQDQNWQPDPYGHPDPRVAAAQSDYPEPFPRSDEPSHAGYDASYGGRRDAAPPQYGAHDQYGAPPPYQQDYADPFYRDGGGHDDYDDHVPARRRGGMLTVMAVIALALIGTAAAFGYRAVFGNGGSSPPPVIKADTTPAKIVPAATPNEQSKQIYDRVGDRPSAERVVSREEKPVDINDSLKNPRVVGSAPVPAANQVAPAANAGLPANASALQPPSAAAPAAPKRVRTVTIKPDGADGESPVATAARAAAQPTIARVASAGPQESVPPPPVPVRTVSTRAPAPQHHAAPPPNPNAPLSLAPPPAAGTASARAPVARTASVAPAAAPARASGGNGGYTVQVSSQRSEGEAQTAFRTLQSKYPEQLGGQQPIIRRADLGDRGVFYRVQIGPFGSSDQASEWCASLKSAGGSCVVQRN